MRYYILIILIMNVLICSINSNVQKIKLIGTLHDVFNTYSGRSHLTFFVNFFFFDIIINKGDEAG